MFLGIEVSKATLDVALLVEPDAPKARHKVFSNTPQGHEQLVAWLWSQGNNPLHVCLEATGTYLFRSHRHLCRSSSYGTA